MTNDLSTYTSLLLSKPTDKRDYTSKYNTPLSNEEVTQFLDWVNKNGRSLEELRDYDLAGVYKDSLTPNGNNQLSDKYKKPNHFTFSDQSIYNGKEGLYGGSWAEQPDGSYTYIVRDNMYSPKELAAYFRRAEQGNRVIDFRPNR
jgi:hypothetical protein